jgi:hypothetical protein
MRRVQITLEPRHRDFLVREAHRCGVSVSALIRRYVAERMEEPISKDDPLARIIGMAEDPHEGDAARDHDRILYSDPYR